MYVFLLTILLCGPVDCRFSDGGTVPVIFESERACMAFVSEAARETDPFWDGAYTCEQEVEL